MSTLTISNPFAQTIKKVAKVIALFYVSFSYFDSFLNGKSTLDELCEHVRVATKWYTFDSKYTFY